MGLNMNASISILVQVRKAFLSALGCHQAARRQQTMQGMRRSSVAYLRKKSGAGMRELKFRNAFPFARKTHEDTYSLQSVSIYPSKVSVAYQPLSLHRR